jgi:hypothetical protein
MHHFKNNHQQQQAQEEKMDAKAITYYCSTNIHNSFLTEEKIFLILSSKLNDRKFHLFFSHRIMLDKQQNISRKNLVKE